MSRTAAQLAGRVLFANLEHDNRLSRASLPVGVLLGLRVRRQRDADCAARENRQEQEARERRTPFISSPWASGFGAAAPRAIHHILLSSGTSYAMSSILGQCTSKLETEALEAANTIAPPCTALLVARRYKKSIVPPCVIASTRR